MTILRTLLDAFLGVERIIVTETERVLVLADGRFESILEPGEHRIRSRGRVIETHRYDITGGAVERGALDLIGALARVRPELAEAHLTEVRTEAGEVAVIHRDGKLHLLLGRDERVWFWKAGGPCSG